MKPLLSPIYTSHNTITFVYNREENKKKNLFGEPEGTTRCCYRLLDIVNAPETFEDYEWNNQ